MIAIQKKISAGMELLKSFTAKNCSLKTENFEELVENQSKEESEM